MNICLYPALLLCLVILLPGCSTLKEVVPPAWQSKEAFKESLIGKRGKEGQYERGVRLYEKKQLIESIELLKPLAMEGNVDAQYLMGLIYAEGYGENIKFKATKDYKRMYKNPTVAAKWFTLAAEQGSIGAMYALGWLFREGEGVIKYLPASHVWFNIAAFKGHEKASMDRDRYDVSGAMTATQITNAEHLASVCIEKELRDCTPLEQYTLVPDDKYVIRHDNDYFAKETELDYLSVSAGFPPSFN